MLIMAEWNGQSGYLPNSNLVLLHLNTFLKKLIESDNAAVLKHAWQVGLPFYMIIKILNSHFTSVYIFIKFNAITYKNTSPELIKINI